MGKMKVIFVGFCVCDMLVMWRVRRVTDIKIQVSVLLETIKVSWEWEWRYKIPKFSHEPHHIPFIKHKKRVRSFTISHISDDEIVKMKLYLIMNVQECMRMMFPTRVSVCVYLVSARIKLHRFLTRENASFDMWKCLSLKERKHSFELFEYFSTKLKLNSINRKLSWKFLIDEMQNCATNIHRKNWKIVQKTFKPNQTKKKCYVQWNCVEWEWKSFTYNSRKYKVKINPGQPNVARNWWNIRFTIMFVIHSQVSILNFYD
jgi:hypothetical protein